MSHAEPPGAAPAAAETFAINVGDTELGAVRWAGAGHAPTVLAVHGITANAWCWGRVARHLAGDVALVAIDLRGRGRSADAPGPTGMRRHADDVAAVVARLGTGPLPVVGHSMGTYVALLAAERHPAEITELVLVDGAAPFSLPEGIDVQAVLDATLGPAIERLRQIYPDVDAYRRFWTEHPSFTMGLTPDIEAYVLSDLVATEGGFRSRVREDAVRTDGAELFADDEVRMALDRLARPVTIIRAERGLFNEPPPLVPLELADRYPQHDWITVPDTNHYDVLVGDAGAAVVADAIRAAAAP